MTNISDRDIRFAAVVWRLQCSFSSLEGNQGCTAEPDQNPNVEGQSFTQPHITHIFTARSR